MNRWKSLAGSTLQDTRYALRWFRREVPLTAAVVLTLGFGIGLNTGVFSVLSGMLFRSRMEKESGRFFQVLAPKLFSTSIAEWKAYREAPGVEETAAWTVSSGRLEDDANASLLMLVSCDFFDLYGLEKAKMGRLFRTAECESSGSAPAVLIGEQIWRDRFHSDGRILGRSIAINGASYEVAGIVPVDFAGRLRGPGIWLPLGMHKAFFGGMDLFQAESRPWLTVEGRRSAGVSQDDLASELNASAVRGGKGPILLTNGSVFQDPSNRALAASASVLLFGALGMILLLACTNVTTLLLSRAVSRRYEMSVRLSLGASRGRLLRMAATEGVMLSLLSGGFSAAIAAAVPAALRYLVRGMPYYPMHTDWLVFTYLAGITLLAGATAALVPAGESLRSDLNSSLRRGGRSGRLRSVLVSAQVALSMVLVVTAALFARTQYRLFVADPDFDSSHVVMAPIQLSNSGLTAEVVANRVRAIGGVSTLAFASSVFWSRAESATIALDGRSEAVTISSVSPNFFETLGVSLDSGTELMSDVPSQVLISRSSAERLWPHRSALHQTFRASDGTAFAVGGVVRDTELDRRSPVPRVYRVMNPSPSNTTILVRGEGDITGVSKQLTSALDSMGVLGRELPRSIDADIREIGSRFRVTAGFATFFGVSAFVLAVIGVYGVMAFAVSRRTKEMGIRLALGATRADIVWEVLRSGLTPVGWGLVAGLPVAAGFAIGLERAFRNTPTPFHALDPLAFGPIAIILILGAAIAMLKPALRACSTNPAASLRGD